MIRKIIHDENLLSMECESVTKADRHVAEDVLHTLMSRPDKYTGIAANMIGENKRIIAYLDKQTRIPLYSVMYDPEIIEASEPYEIEEYCHAYLAGPVSCVRYKYITVKYKSFNMKIHVEKYKGRTARVIQHLVDHCNGKLV